MSDAYDYLCRVLAHPERPHVFNPPARSADEPDGLAGETAPASRAVCCCPACVRHRDRVRRGKEPNYE